jgi:polysaccharide biosynthesis protein PslH
MNLLVIAAQLPYPFDNGALARLYNLYSRLGKKHRITWVCPIWNGTEKNISGAMQFVERVVELPKSDERPLPSKGWRYLLLRAVAPFHWERLFVYCFGYVNSPGVYWMIQTPERLDLIKKLTSETQFDAILCEFEGNAELAVPSIPLPKVILTHNVQSIMFKRRKIYSMTWEDRLFYWPEYLKVLFYEKKNYANFNLGITVSLDDRKALIANVPGLRVENIPNGVDIDFYQPRSEEPEPKTLVYIGNYSYPPNEDAALYFCNEIFPLIRARDKEIKVIFVGKNPPAQIIHTEGVEATGYVDDIRPYMAGATIVIVPLRVGGGTRLKILDALSMGKAIVSTSLGAEGIDARHGEDILIADTPRDFADRVVEMVHNPGLRKKLEVNGRELAKKKYDWDILAEDLDRYLHEVVEDYRHKSESS